MCGSAGTKPNIVVLSDTSAPRHVIRRLADRPTDRPTQPCAGTKCICFTLVQSALSVLTSVGVGLGEGESRRSRRGKLLTAALIRPAGLYFSTFLPRSLHVADSRAAPKPTFSFLFNRMTHESKLSRLAEYEEPEDEVDITIV
ncbi:unnamed protein product [Protopolystoma xenopodis]|uniref:Uncharacterized protein n=1 Tax=Protopolystoma xenopodis TaxID=117903 RepID=A0A3S5AQV3_9PLAT|nr:unnamed protein product [Protopolystoma xenopodis]